MSILAFLFIAFMATLGSTSPMKSKHYENLPQEKFTELASQQLQSFRNKRATETEPPCGVVKDTKRIKCYVPLKLNDTQSKVGIVYGWDSSADGLAMILIMDNYKLKPRVHSKNEICAPLGDKFKSLDLCIKAYYIDFTKNPVSLDVCFLLKVTNLLQKNLKCIKIEPNGKISHANDHAPSSVTRYSLSVNKSVAKFNFQNTVPKNILNKIKNGFKNLASKIVGGLQTVWNKTKDFFG